MIRHKKIINTGKTRPQTTEIHLAKPYKDSTQKITQQQLRKKTTYPRATTSNEQRAKRHRLTPGASTLDHQPQNLLTPHS